MCKCVDKLDRKAIHFQWLSLAQKCLLLKLPRENNKTFNSIATTDVEVMVHFLKLASMWYH